MELTYTFHHVFLPPRLPQKDDSSFAHDMSLVKGVLEALIAFDEHQDSPQLQSCVKMLRCMIDMRDSAALLESRLDKALISMESGDTLALHIQAQNAGLVIRRSSKDYIFEAFELSPNNEAVMSTKGRLQRAFPGPAMSVSKEVVDDVNFRQPFVKLLCQLDAETPHEVQPHTTKAKSKVTEIRESITPTFVTEMLMGILRGIGNPYEADRVWKNTRDDVLWLNTLIPWRRSPLWLLLRVALQTTLKPDRDTTQITCYKSFMIFFMARLLDFAVKKEFSCDTLKIMTAKISRRVLKLNTTKRDLWLVNILSVLDCANDLMNKRWMVLQKDPDPTRIFEAWTPTKLDVMKDSRLTLKAVKPYLQAIQDLQDSRENQDSIPEQPSIALHCKPRIGKSWPNLPKFSAAYDDQYLLLADFEHWVSDSLGQWLMSVVETTQACTDIARTIDDYSRLAAAAYVNKPESYSIMIVVLMELWVALDKCATKRHPLLLDYDTGFNSTLFDPLLLSKKSEMERLYHVEQYLAARKEKRKYPSTFIFQRATHTESLGVRYVEDSLSHQELRRRIEIAAKAEREKKIAELNNLKSQYADLMALYDNADCSYRKSKRGNLVHHASLCYKCSLHRQAIDLSIVVYEWPLPQDNLSAKAAVFELDTPIEISKWRDATFHILIDRCSPDILASRGRGEGGIYTLYGYSGIRSYIRTATNRVQLASQNKPFTKTHYSTQKISQASVDSICVNNGLSFKMYDATRETWTDNLVGKATLWKLCTLQLSSTRYGSCQFALDGTKHTPNEVLAKQDKCPPMLTLHQHYNFCMLRSGHRLQWLNIAKELHTRELDFNHEEVYTLLMQAIWQAGPQQAGKFCRESHIDLEETDFGLSILSVLEEALSGVAENWQGTVAVCSFVSIAQKVMSFTSSTRVIDLCLSFLRRARSITTRWSRDLVLLTGRAEKDVDLKNLHAKALEVALTCHSTFDVEDDYLSVIVSTDEDISAYSECSITIHDRRPPSADHLSQFVQGMLRKSKRLAQRLEDTYRNKISQGGGGLDEAVSRVWAGYTPGTKWVSMLGKAKCWLKTETKSRENTRAMTVHYNILYGDLLVNGVPLARLPLAFEAHETYIRLFNESILDVVPSSMTGMQFETRSAICNKQVHFSMHGSELIIRTVSDGEVHELIPLHALGKDFPKAFIQDYVHWYSWKTSSVEWRPLKTPWTSTATDWQLIRDSDVEINWFLRKGTSRLVDVRSLTSEQICGLLSPLQESTDIHTFVDTETRQLTVDLPRMKLQFILKAGSEALESKTFRGMFVDRNQSFGSFTGLKSKLVLAGPVETARIVIIPEGKFTFFVSDHHVNVSINVGTSKDVKYHVYTIDTQLGLLSDNGSLKSRLVRAYLHALTSHCLVDDLTGRTGTEEALYSLTMASTRSLAMAGIGSEEQKLLNDISELTPERRYYPRGSTKTQTVSWNSLSSLSQHASFFKQARSLLELSTSFAFLSQKTLDLPLLHLGDDNLLERARIRDAWVRVGQFGAEDFSTSYDILYADRERHPDNQREKEVYRTSRLVTQWSTNLCTIPNLLDEIHSWKEDIQGPSEDLPPMKFSSLWLQPPETFLPQLWCSLHEKLSNCNIQTEKYQVMILLATLSYAQAEKTLVQTLLALATSPILRQIRPPSFPRFILTDGYKPLNERVRQILVQHTRPIVQCPEVRLQRELEEDDEDLTIRRESEYTKRKEEEIRLLACHVISQWPETHVSADRNAFNIHINFDKAVVDIRVYFASCHRNDEFLRYIMRVQSALNCLSGSWHPQSYKIPRPLRERSNNSTIDTFVTSRDLMSKVAPVLKQINYETFDHFIERRDSGVKDCVELEKMLLDLSEESSAGYEATYSNDLLESFATYRKGAADTYISPSESLYNAVDQHLLDCRSQAADMYQSICSHLVVPLDICQEITEKAGFFPRISPASLLSLLASSSQSDLSPQWKDALLKYGIALTALQRAQRLKISCGNTTELQAEVINTGYQGWDPQQYPDWLVLQIENNLLIREEQALIAREMLSPSSNANAIMQLNMGLGKSSVIVPIAAAALADRKKLVRVVVLKSLSTQMLQLLVKKLGNLLGRRIFHMPISRSLQFDIEQARKVCKLYEECMCEGGIILVQPEHLLSFELMGYEQLQSHPEIGNILIDAQRWLVENSRDILDESDEILSVRFELIYTMGAQRSIEFSPDRWTLIQDVMSIVGRHARSLGHSDGLEVLDEHPGGFPRLRIIIKSIGKTLLSAVAREICETGLRGIPIWNLSRAVRDEIYRFITTPNFPAPSDDSVASCSSSSAKNSIPLLREVLSIDSIKQSLLLLRGLFGNGIGNFALQQKRWRVNYGLDHEPRRTMLAIPFHAKDTPAARAEFSHPDAAILMTCLSYYYGGLSDQELRNSFELLLLSDNAQDEYNSWVAEIPDLPPAFRQVGGINLSNTTQCSAEVFPALRFSKGVIDFYLSRIVFPKEMKEFPKKLSSSGWNIARQKSHITTGFSGTNDTRYLLPLTVTQCDLPQQLGTNALVLDCLLRAENTFEDISAGTASHVFDAHLLLNAAVQAQPPIRVILDVGAQVLEMKNEEVAKHWLKLVSESDVSTAEAVVFFDDDNDLCVLRRDGVKEPLMVSSFSKQMDQCLVYLDEAHTRGTDLQMPANYRALVTLGPDLTKDRLAQACMRMRKLGKGQSVAFCAPNEVKRRILQEDKNSVIKVSDVLKWCISNTCTHTRKIVPLWATQGVRYLRYLATCMDVSIMPGNFPLEVSEKLLEDEAQSLEQRYGDKNHAKEILWDAGHGLPTESNKDIEAIRTKCRDFHVSSFSSASLHEEQERELSPENEKEVQIERPPPSEPLKHSMQKSVQQFASSGIFHQPSFVAAFSPFESTSISASLELAGWPDTLFLTNDFVRTIKAGPNDFWDEFVRPVQWILSRTIESETYYIVISPFEAQELLPTIRQLEGAVHLHLYSPRVNACVRSIEDLSFCAIPAMTQPNATSFQVTSHMLNLFAGQLYLRDYETYVSLCQLLGLCSAAPTEDMQVMSDGFVKPEDREPLMKAMCRFTKSPVPFLRGVMRFRRKGSSYGTTHMGRIFNGDLLTREHFKSVPSGSRVVELDN